MNIEEGTTLRCLEDISAHSRGEVEIDTFIRFEKNDEVVVESIVEVNEDTVAFSVNDEKSPLPGMVFVMHKDGTSPLFGTSFNEQFEIVA